MKRPLSQIIMSHLNDFGFDKNRDHIEFVKFLVFNYDEDKLSTGIDPKEEWKKFKAEGIEENTSALPSFDQFVNEEFMIAGFGPATQRPNVIPNSVPTTGYSMKPIAYHMDQIGSIAANEACTYESNDNPEHKGDDYIAEAKKRVCEKIDECYENKKTW